MKLPQHGNVLRKAKILLNFSICTFNKNCYSYIKNAIIMFPCSVRIRNNSKKKNGPDSLPVATLPQINNNFVCEEKLDIQHS